MCGSIFPFAGNTREVEVRVPRTEDKVALLSFRTRDQSRTDRIAAQGFCGDLSSGPKIEGVCVCVCVFDGNLLVVLKEHLKSTTILGGPLKDPCSCTLQTSPSTEPPLFGCFSFGDPFLVDKGKPEETPLHLKGPPPKRKHARPFVREKGTSVVRGC